MKKHGNSKSMKISKYKINPSVADVLQAFEETESQINRNRLRKAFPEHKMKLFTHMLTPTP